VNPALTVTVRQSMSALFLVKMFLFLGELMAFDTLLVAFLAQSKLGLLSAITPCLISCLLSRL
jgi:hypothetical protein